MTRSQARNQRLQQQQRRVVLPGKEHPQDAIPTATETFQTAPKTAQLYCGDCKYGQNIIVSDVNANLINMIRAHISLIRQLQQAQVQ